MICSSYETSLSIPSIVSQGEKLLTKTVVETSLVVQWIESAQCRGHGLRPGPERASMCVEQLSPGAATTEPAPSPRVTATEPASRSYRARERLQSPRVTATEPVEPSWQSPRSRASRATP